MTSSWFISLSVLVALFPSCTKKQDPEKESKIGLEQAMKGVEQAEEGFKRMREKGGALQHKIDEQTKLLDATIAKHVGVLGERVSAGEKMLSNLPFEKQTALRPMLPDLKQQVASVEAALREYGGAASSAEEEAKRKLQAALEKLNATTAQFEAQMREPVSQ